MSPPPGCADAMGRNRMRYACALTAALIFYIAYREWLSWLLLLVVLGLPWLSLLVSLPLLRSFQVVISGPESCRMGESVRLTLKASGRGAVPPFSGRLRLTRVTTGETWSCRDFAAVPTDHCGCIRAVPENIRLSDVLGLFRFRMRRVPPERILVRPNPVPMEKIPELRKVMARSWRPKPGGGYAEQHEMRLYRPGDSLNQVHWKLTAKTGKPIVREPQSPDPGLVLLTLDLCGTAAELDRKLGKLLWLGRFLMEQGISFEIRAMTGAGIFSRQVKTPACLDAALDTLLDTPPAEEGSVLDREFRASWHCHLGGEPDES